MSTDPRAVLLPAPLPAAEPALSAVTEGFLRPALGGDRWALARQQIDAALHQRLVVAFVGSASAGKDAAIKALFGVDFGEVDPIPGSTATVRAVPLNADGNVILVNSPGFGDLRAEVDASIRALIGQVDLAVYLVNADGGATAEERKQLDLLRSSGRPVLVCLNKIDLIRPSQRADFVARTLAQLEVAPADAVVTAFDPMPALSETPIGLDEVSDRIMRALEVGGKGLLFAKQLRNKANASESVIRSAARRAALAGAIPVPGVDITVVTTVQVRMITELAAVYGQRLDRDVALFIAGEALSGVGRGFSKWAITALKGAGWIPGGQVGELAATALGASVAAASTYGVGRAAIRYLEAAAKGQTPTGGELREVFDEAATLFRRESGALSATGGGAPALKTLE
jgi:GTP-binding protein Era